MRWKFKALPRNAISCVSAVGVVYDVAFPLLPPHLLPPALGVASAELTLLSDLLIGGLSYSPCTSSAAKLSLPLSSHKSPT